MAIFRVEKSRDFTVMSNFHLKDKSLTLKAKGLLSMILSLPEEWNYTTRGLATICKEGVDSISATLRELESAGYILRRRMRDAKGKITDTEYTIYERPHVPEVDAQPASPDTDHPYTENPYMDNPDTDSPETGAPCTDMSAQLNTNRINTHGSNPKKSNTHKINIHQSIGYAGAASHSRQNSRPDWMDRIDVIESYREQIMANIDYACLSGQYGAERLDEVVELMLETILSKRDNIRIAGDEYHRDVVKSRLLKVNSTHLMYVFDCLDKNTTKVRNIKAYLLTALYNAPVTMDSYYRAEVNHDLFAG